MAFLRRLLSKRRRERPTGLFLDIENVLPDFSISMQHNIRFIHSLALLSKAKIGFHSSDADGIVSAVILKALNEEFQNAVYIPLDYQEIRHLEFGHFLRHLDWLAIVDLPPLNEHEMLLYVDHHTSNKNLRKLAQNIIFDENAPSTAFLLAHRFKEQLSKNLLLLADLTTITDTGDFSIDPPSDLPSTIPTSKQKQAWLLNDLCHTPESRKDVLQLVQDLSINELEIINNDWYRHRISHLRTVRKNSMELGDNIEVSDVMIIIRGKKKIMTSAVVHRLFERGTKITCVFFPGKKFTGLSFRVNPLINNSEIDLYRVDLIASEFNGGGHSKAAGGRCESFSKALEGVKEWIQRKNFSYQIYDLRKSE